MEYMYDGFGVKRLESMNTVCFSAVGADAPAQVWRRVDAWLDEKNLRANEQVRCFGMQRAGQESHGPGGYECRVAAPGYVQVDADLPRAVLDGGMYVCLRVLHPDYFGKAALERGWRLLSGWVRQAGVEVGVQDWHSKPPLEERALVDGVTCTTLYYPLDEKKFLGEGEQAYTASQEMPASEPVFRLKLNLDQEYPDDEGEQARYQPGVSAVSAPDIAARTDNARTGVFAAVKERGPLTPVDDFTAALEEQIPAHDPQHSDWGAGPGAAVTPAGSAYAPAKPVSLAPERNTPGDAHPDASQPAPDGKSRMIDAIAGRVADAIDREEKEQNW